MTAGEREREEVLMIQKSLHLFNILLTLTSLQTPNGPLLLSVSQELRLFD